MHARCRRVERDPQEPGLIPSSARMSGRAPLLIVVCLALALPGSVGPAAAAPSDAVVAFVGGEVRPVSGPVIARGTVVVRSGKIEAVGADVEVPAGATVIDCAGKIVTPGLIDADSALGLDAAALTSGLPGADVVAADAFDGWDARLRTALRQGVTTLHLGAGRTQSIGGLTSVVSAGPAGAAPLQASGALVLNVSTSASASGLPGATRAAGLRSLLIAAQYRETDLERWRRDLSEYEQERLADGPLPEELILIPPALLESMQQWSAADRVAWREAAYKSMGRPKSYTKPKKTPAPPPTPNDDPNMETVASVMGAGGENVRRTFLRAELSNDVGAALDMVRDFDLDAVIAGGEGLRDRADELQKAQVAVVLTHAGDTDRSRTSPLFRRETGLGAALAKAGLQPAIASGGAASARFLRLLVAREVGEGMERDAGLASVTLWAATAIGVEAQAGSLDVGKRADIVVWDGDPLAAASRAARVFVGGEEVDLARE